MKTNNVRKNSFFFLIFLFKNIHKFTSTDVQAEENMDGRETQSPAKRRKTQKKAFSVIYRAAT